MNRWIAAMFVWLTFFATCHVHAQGHGMHVAVLPDRVLIGSEFVPRRLDLPNKVQVLAGQNVTLTAGSYDYIETAGVLNVPAITFSATTVIVLPGGTLNVACGANWTVRNVPMDTARDPFTWGNGFLNFGAFNAVCDEKTPFVALAGPAANGATSITLASDVLGWVVGDELVLPDTQQMSSPGSGGSAVPRRETGTLIASITGRTIGLSKPLAFARAAITRPDGSVVIQPRVANLGRRTVIKSESPTGVRGHVAMIGGATSWDVVGVAFVGLGRTRPIPLNSTPATGTPIGTNQIGRYAFHMHHVFTSLLTRRIDSSVFQGLGVAKWGGPVIHQSHDIDITNNVCVDVPGSCFVTEDGNEIRNVFRKNFAAYVVGNGKDARVNMSENNPGVESAFWFHGVGNVIDANEAWNSQSSIDLFNQAFLATGVQVPSVKGGPPDVTPNLQAMVPISSNANVTASNPDSGYEYWSVSEFPNTNLISAHNGAKNVWNGQADARAAIVLHDPILIGSGPGTRECVASSIGYNTGVEILRGEVRGCQNGISGGIGLVYGKFTETVFQSIRNFYFEQGWPPLTFTRLVFQKLGTHPLSYFETQPPLVEWTGPPMPLPDNIGQWSNFGLSNVVITDWNGTPNDYRLVGPPSRRPALAWYGQSSVGYVLPPPDCGKTLGETWDKCGMSYGGQPFAPSDAVALDGVINMLAVPEPRPPIGPPHAIMTAPNMRAPAVLSPERPGTVTGVMAFSGDSTKADDRGYFSIDGGPRQVVGRNWLPHYQWFALNVITPGIHSVRTWRELNGVEVAGSSVVTQYYIGDPIPPEPPPPNPCLTNPLTPTVTVSAPGHTVTWSGTLTATDERGCKGTVSQ